MYRSLWILALIGSGTLHMPAKAADAYARVVDVGNGLCVVIRTPEGHSMVFDTGDRGGHCARAVNEIIPEPTVDLLVLSHSDADHITDTSEILRTKHVARIVYALDDHNLTQTLEGERAAIAQAGAMGTDVWELVAKPLPDPDTGEVRKIKIGQEATATVIAGWGNGDSTRGPGEPVLPDAEHRNALSTVVRFQYGAHSLLLTGDTVGRLLTDPGTTCAYAERIMAANAAAWPIDSDVLIGQHHGGNNASSNCFIRAVSPTWVIFSAGHKGYHHPTQAAADRYLANGVDKDKMLRTDRGDDEGPGEWVYGDIRGCVDQAGDDDIEITMPSVGDGLRVQYKEAARPCEVRTRAFYHRVLKRRTRH